jgi:succinate dehydrogenase / fumarate reductase, membrane anchor subunit
MSLTTPLRQVLGAGPAGQGVHHWWLQRLTSLALVPLSIWFVVSLLALPSLDHFTVVSWLGQGASALLLILFVLIGTWHSQLGVRVIIEDYVHGAGAKTLLLVLTGFAHVLIGAVGVFAIVKIALGGAA